MKYELEPDNRNCPDEELLADLRATARKLNRQSITKEQYDEHGRFCAATMQKRFSSWNQALTLAELNIKKRMNIPREEILEDIKQLAEELHLNTLSSSIYRKHGQFSLELVRRTFTTWGKALAAAGLNPTGNKRNITEEQLFNNMATVWEHIGRQPRQTDFRPPLSQYSAATYVNRYGSWRKALEAFVSFMNAEASAGLSKIENQTLLDNDISDDQLPSVHPKTSRNISWRLRFLVMRRDNFKCQACGQSPALQPGIVLHVDHIKAWVLGGETTMDNLQTLCEQCNIGKSDLAMHEEIEC